MQCSMENPENGRVVFVVNVKSLHILRSFLGLTALPQLFRCSVAPGVLARQTGETPVQ